MDVTNEVLLAVFAELLGQQSGDRQLAEQRLEALEVLNSYPTTLVNLLIDERVPVNFRQMAGIRLEHYVSAHWTEHEDHPNTRHVSLTEESKAYIRSSLVRALHTGERRIRTTVAYLIFLISRSDWPDSWPTLIAELVELLNSALSQVDVKPGQQKAVFHGVLAILSHLSGNVSDLDAPRIIPTVMPSLIRILCEKSFSYTVRKNAASVIGNFANSVYEVMFKQYIACYLGPCLKELYTELSSSNLPLESCLFENELIQLLTLLCTISPKYFTDELKSCLAALGTLTYQMLERITETYLRSNVSSGNGGETEELDDSDGDTLEYETLVYSLLELFSHILNTKRYRPLLGPHLADITYQLARLLQLPVSTIKKSQEINEFLEEIEGTLNNTVRHVALEVFQTFADVVPSWLSLFTLTVLRLFEAAENQLAHSDPDWWKLLEVGLFLCSTFPTSFTLADSSISVDLLKSRYLEPSWQQTDLPFLQISALNCATQFSIHDCPAGPSLESLPSLLLSALDPSKHPLIRVSAVSTLSDACPRLRHVCEDPSTNSQTKLTITSQLPNLLAQVVDALATFGEPVLDNGVYALQGLLRIDAQCFSLSAHPQLLTIIVDLFKHCISVATTLSVYLDLLRTLQLSGNSSVLEEGFLPTLLPCLEQPQQQASDTVALEASLHVLCVIVRGSLPPLSETLIRRAFPAVVHLAIIGEDAMLLSVCCEVLRCYLAVDVASVLAWHDDEGNNGIGYILHVTSRLLDPSAPVEWATVAGRLVCAILLRLQGEQLGENTDLLLRGTLARLSSLPVEASGSHRCAQQSLVFVFIVLCRMRTEAAIEFLANVPDLSGKPVIEQVMRLWCDCQPFYNAQHEIRISIQAMSNLLVHTITTKDSRLMQITMEEVIECDDDARSAVATRTRRKKQNIPKVRLQIPLMAKMYKLLIAELAKTLEDELDDGADDADSTSEEEVTELGDDHLGETTGTVSQQQRHPADDPHVDTTGKSEDTSEEDPLQVDDPIYTNDPAMKLDVKEHICTLFRELVQLPFYNEFSRYHSKEELSTLQNVGILQLD